MQTHATWPVAPANSSNLSRSVSNRAVHEEGGGLMEFVLLSDQAEQVFELVNMAVAILAGIGAIVLITMVKGEMGRAWRVVGAGVTVFALSELVGGRSRAFGDAPREDLAEVISLGQFDGRTHPPRVQAIGSPRPADRTRGTRTL
jgi:hypothetical protein